MLDDILTVIPAIGDKLDVVMVPKVEGPWDIHYIDRLLAQLEAKYEIKKSLQLHAILETALGVSNVEEICAASPRMQGISLGPADLAASRRMKTTRVGGGHPGVPGDRRPRREEPRRAAAHGAAGPLALHVRPHGRRLQLGRHPAVLRPVRRDRGPGGVPVPVPRGVPDGLRRHLDAAPVARSRSPSASSAQRSRRSTTAKRIIEAMGDGTGTVMLDGRMQDDATFKQAQVMVRRRS